jgi:energy-coupling factor transporter ATP-binding protein EcfA2
MLFARVGRSSKWGLTGRNQAFLIDDGWDDYTFKTTFLLVVFDDEGNRIEVGEVKILSKGLETGRVSIPDSFDLLDLEYCSVGQSENYYETLGSLPGGFGNEILRALRDCVENPSIYYEFRGEKGFQDSLLRAISGSSVLETFARALKGLTVLAPFRFTYAFPDNGGQEPTPKLNFDVVPGSIPPTNVHVVIGRNGVGKTHLLGNLAMLLCRGRSEPVPEAGRLDFVPDEPSGQRFANLITVTFSAFDPFRAPQSEALTDGDMRYAYVGLKKPPKLMQGVDPSPGLENTEVKRLEEFTSEFQASLASCLSGPRRGRWLQAVRTLEADPGFADLGIPALVSETSGDPSVSAVSDLYSHLSAGHKIVFLIVTRLVELTEERTLVLLDEPEAHLHPPLLSSFVRVLSNLLTSRNGAAIVATHSPVVLQEVPRSCVWVLRRSGIVVNAERPEIETFGENMGVLTREVFGLEVTASGFHQLLKSQIFEHPQDYDGLVRAFGNQLGAEAKGIARALIKSEG